MQPDIEDVAFAAQRHGGVEFLADDLEHAGHTGLAAGTQTIQHRPADKG